MQQTGDMIMSSIASAAVEASNYNLVHAMAGLWAQLSARFYKFLEQLPESCGDVDPEVFKRASVPI
jgi:hypothetical protein